MRALLLLMGAGLVGALGRAQENRLAWPAPFTVQGYVSSSPAVSRDGSTIYVGVETRTLRGRVFAITREGARKWVAPSERDEFAGAIISSPAVGPDGTVYVGSGTGRLYALHPETGAIRWEYNTGSVLAYISSSPAVGDDGTVYFGAGDGKVRAVNNGNLRWERETGLEVGGVKRIDFSSPAIAPDGTVYIGSHDRHLYAIRPDGSERWRFITGGIIDSSPAIGRDGTIYFGSNDQRVYAVAPDGTKRWDRLTNGVVQSSPVIAADGSIIIASADTNLYSLDPQDGSDRWNPVSFGASTQSTPAIRGDGVIIFGADDNKVRAFSATGTPLWTFNGVQGEDDLIEGSPLVAPDGAIYIGSSDGLVYKLAGNGSPLSAFSPWPAYRRDAHHTARATPPPPQDRLANIATRARLSGNDTLIAGFVVGVEQRTNLIRAIGPGLAAIGVGGFLPDPRLELFAGSVSLQRVDDWSERDPLSGFSLPETALAVGAFALTPDSKDAAILRPLIPGSFTAHVTSVDGRGGVALVEVYDTPGATAGRLLNISTRGRVGVGEDILIAGFVVRGDAPMRLLLRGIGPGLSQFGIGGVLARPRLEVFRGSTSVAVNSGWVATGFKQDIASAAALVSAFSLNENALDAAMIFEALPGPHTVQISGLGGTTGEAIVEIYVLP